MRVEDSDFDRFSGVAGETGFGEGKLRVCIRCEQAPGLHQEEDYLPVCRFCKREVESLPLEEMQEEIGRLWEMYPER